MFKISIKTGEQKIAYKPSSLSLKYLVNEKKLDQSLTNIEKVVNIKFTEIQRKTLLSKDGKEVRIPKHNGKPDEMVFIKVNIDEKFNADHFRNHLAGFIASLKNEEVKNVHIFIPHYDLFKKYFASEDYYYRTFMEGILLGNYEFSRYKSGDKKIKDLEVFFYANNEKLLRKAVKTTINLIEGINFTKDLENEPANVINPETLSRKIIKVLSPAGIKVRVFDEAEIKKRKMGGLLAVGGGSSNKPRFIVMNYNGAGKSKSKTIALVGKGVTFDSGGISIKPAPEMWEMKADMSGAASVAGIILAAAKEKLPVNILGIIPAAENMPSGSSMRPGDIVVTASGKSIEVDNTDAEGRVILADALDYASKNKSDVIIDMATLTGACVVALGEFTAGLFTKNEELKNSLYNAGLKTYERTWPMPMWDEFAQLNKSEVADVKNVGGRWGGAVAAAKFLETFVDKQIPWAHIDIAGPAMPHNFSNYTKKYMTGFGVRLVFEYLKEITG